MAMMHQADAAVPSPTEVQEEEFEVEDILRYRRAENGEEFFFVKWVGYSVDDATWEPLEHMNDNCRELIAKARALFAWRRSPTSSPGIPALGLGNQANAALPVGLEISSPVAEIDMHVAPPQRTPAGGLLSEKEAPLMMQQLSHHNTELMMAPSVSQDDLGAVYVEDVGDEEVSLWTPSSNPATLMPTVVAPWQQQNNLQNVPLQHQQEIAGSNGQGLLPLGKSGGNKPTLPQPPAKRPKLAGAPEVEDSAPKPPPTAPPGGGGGGNNTANIAAAAGPGGRVVIVPKAKPSATTPPPRPARVDMKCICGSSDKGVNSKGLVICRLCSSGLHTTCVEGALNRGLPKEYVCPPCRVERVDEFHPPIGAGLLRHSFASASSTLSLTFTAQPQQWAKQQWAVHLRAVPLGSSALGGPAWPHRVQGKLNGRQCVAIDPPKHLHVRREQCYNLTPLLKQGLNNLELRFTPKPDANRFEPEEGYCVGVVLTRPRSSASIVARVRTRCTESVATSKERVGTIINSTADETSDDVIATGDFGRKLKPLCPISFSPIEEAAVGRNCAHVQVFDLQSYVAVNQRMRSLDKRWTCPVCSKSVRPDDVILDPFAQHILDTLRGDEDLVEAVVFDENCEWSTVSAVKDDERGEGNGPAADDGFTPKEAAPMIDLSDSE